MANVPGLPKFSQPLIEVNGATATSWYRFWSNLSNITVTVDGIQQEIDDLKAEIAAIPAGTQVRGQLSIAQSGSPAPGGIITLTLQGDTASPGNRFRYGTDSTGNKGWASVLSDFAATSNISVSAAGTGIVSFDLTNVTVASGGTLQRYGFDAKGRLSQSAAATTDNLNEGSTNLYFTKPRVAASLVPGTGISIAVDGLGNSTISNAAVVLNNLTSQAGDQLTDQSGSNNLVTNTSGGQLTPLPAFTLATLPSVSLYQYCLIIVTDLTGGVEPCFSDGTNWRRCSDKSIAN